MENNVLKEIHVYLTGRLGNQLFQYAFAKSLQEKYGGRIFLNVYELEHRSEKMKHVPGKFKYELSSFVLNDNVILEDKKPKWFYFLGNPINRFFRKFFHKLYFKLLSKFGYYLWMNDDYIEIPKIKTNKVYLCGWWQYFEYYKNVEPILRKEIVSRTELLKKNKHIYELAKDNESVCVSIRGGNYFEPKVKKHLYVCNPDYFYDSIDFMISKIANPKFVIFSDDLKWAKESLNFEAKYPNITFVYEDGTDSVEEKLRMMSSFSNFIISNSTFSWWAQYLSNSRKIVCAPNIWFTNGKKCGLYMKEWNLIDIKNL